jgi:GxxExxY protein
MEQPDDSKLAHAVVTRAILGCFFEVYRELGYGFSEAVYRRALAIVIRAAGLNAIQEVPLSVHFRGDVIGRFYADLLVDGVVLIEIKAAANIESYAVAQLLNYLKAAGGGVGLLLNFGREPGVKRLVLGKSASILSTGPGT